MIGFLLFCLILIVAAFIGSYAVFKLLIGKIWEKLIMLDKIFDERYNELSKTIFQFQKYMPEHKNLIFDIQKSKADTAKVSKPKTMEELSQKILNENALTLNINYLLDKCDFQKIPYEMKECVTRQSELSRKITEIAEEYNKLILFYKQIKEKFPFTWYSKLTGIELDIDTIKTE